MVPSFKSRLGKFSFKCTKRKKGRPHFRSPYYQENSSHSRTGDNFPPLSQIRFCPTDRCLKQSATHFHYGLEETWGCVTFFSQILSREVWFIKRGEPCLIPFLIYRTSYVKGLSKNNCKTNLKREASWQLGMTCQVGSNRNVFPVCGLQCLRQSLKINVWVVLSRGRHQPLKLTIFCKIVFLSITAWSWPNNIFWCNSDSYKNHKTFFKVVESTGTRLTQYSYL